MLAGRAPLAAPPEPRSASRSTCDEQAREAAARARHRDRGRAARAPPAPPPRSPERRPIAGAGGGGGGHHRRARVERPGSADAQPPPAKRVEARVFDESGPLVAVWFNQPWVARRAARRARTAAPREAEEARNEFWVTSSSRATAAGAPVHTLGLVPVYPAHRGPAAGRGCASWPGRVRERVHDASSRCPRACASRSGWRSARPRSRRRTSRSSEDDERRRAPPARVRGAVPAPARRGRAPPARAARGQAVARARRPPGELVDRWRWSLPFELDGRPADARSSDIDADLAARAADAAPADGRGGVRQDGGRAARDAPRGRERRPGRADGAHRDAGRAAPRARSTRLLGGLRADRAARPAPRPRRGGASCSTRLASGELSLLVGTHALIEDAVEFRELAVVRGRRAAPLRRAPAGARSTRRRPTGWRRTRST